MAGALCIIYFINGVTPAAFLASIHTLNINSTGAYPFLRADWRGGGAITEMSFLKGSSRYKYAPTQNPVLVCAAGGLYFPLGPTQLYDDYYDYNDYMDYSDSG